MVKLLYICSGVTDVLTSVLKFRKKLKLININFYLLFRMGSRSLNIVNGFIYLNTVKHTGHRYRISYDMAGTWRSNKFLKLRHGYIIDTAKTFSGVCMCTLILYGTQNDKTRLIYIEMDI